MDPDPEHSREVYSTTRNVKFYRQIFIFTLTEHTYNILYIILVELPLLISSLLPLGRGPPLGCRAEIRTRPAVQQADAVLSEPRRINIYFVKKCVDWWIIFFYLQENHSSWWLQLLPVPVYRCANGSEGRAPGKDNMYYKIQEYIAKFNYMAWICASPDWPAIGLKAILVYCASRLVSR